MTQSRYKFMLNVLLKSETIILEVSKILKPNLVDEYYVCPAVMIELIMENKYIMDGDDTVPASYRDIKEARRKVKAFEWNSQLAPRRPRSPGSGSRAPANAGRGSRGNGKSGRW